MNKYTIDEIIKFDALINADDIPINEIFESVSEVSLNEEKKNSILKRLKNDIISNKTFGEILTIYSEKNKKNILDIAEEVEAPNDIIFKLFNDKIFPFKVPIMIVNRIIKTLNIEINIVLKSINITIDVLINSFLNSNKDGFTGYMYSRKSSTNLDLENYFQLFPDKKIKNINKLNINYLHKLETLNLIK